MDVEKQCADPQHHTRLTTQQDIENYTEENRCYGGSLKFNPPSLTTTSLKHKHACVVMLKAALGR